MANILKVTTPVGGYDGANNVRGNPELQNPVNVQGPVNPEKVARPDARSDAAGDQGEAALQFKFETNFDSFIQQLKNMPILAEELPKLFGEFAGLSAESGISKNFAQEIAQFLNMINISSGNIEGFLKDQGMSAVRYTGSFFSLLRKIMSETKSVELRNSILNFLKRYTDMAESGNVLKDIQRNMKEILQRMLPQQREQAAALEKGLIYNSDGSSAQMAENLKALKSDILPYLNSYISKIHDRGELRDAVAYIANLTARYENGLPEGVLQAFEKLLDYQAMQKYFNGFDVGRLFEILAGTEFEQASARNAQMDRLAEIISRGASGEAGIENKQVFRQIMNAIILNESVYMPVLHMMIPVNVDGRLMFSEMWVDPDAEGGGEKEDGSRERLVKGLVKFDIEDVGFFDMFFLYGENRVSLQLNVPAALSADSQKIRSDLQQILREHSLETEELVLGSSDVSIPITEAFTNIKERKNSINVSV